MSGTDSTSTQPTEAADKEGQEGEEEDAAPAAASTGVAESYKDMAEKGAHVKGEGELP